MFLNSIFDGAKFFLRVFDGANKWSYFVARSTTLL
jgi:hypothetical protein